MFRCFFLLTPVIELNNLLRYTKLEYLNANDRNMAIISLFYMEHSIRSINDLYVCEYLKFRQLYVTLSVLSSNDGAAQRC